MNDMAVITIKGDVPSNTIVLCGSVASCIMLARRYEHWIGRDNITIIDGNTGSVVQW